MFWRWRHGLKLWQIQGWHSWVFIITVQKSSGSCATAFSTGGKNNVTYSLSDYPGSRPLLLGDELLEIVIRRHFQTLLVLSNCSSHFFIISLEDRSYAAYIRPALCESPQIFTVTLFQFHRLVIKVLQHQTHAGIAAALLNDVNS